MSLAFQDFSRSALRFGATALTSLFVAANANAAPPAVGQCAPAEAVKSAMLAADYVPLVPFDKTFLKPDGSKVNRRYGFWANKNDMSEGYYIGRHSNGDMCNEGELSGIILADNRTKKIDPRAFSKAPKANQENGLNLVLNNVAKNVSEYPMIQAQITDADGARGYITITANPSTRTGSYLLSNMAGTVINSDTLDAGEINGQKYGPQYTPVALSILDGKNKTADAGSQTVTIASIAPR